MNIAAKGLTLGSAKDVQHVVLGPFRQDLNQFEHRFHSLEDLNNKNPFSISMLALPAMQHILQCTMQLKHSFYMLSWRFHGARTCTIYSQKTQKPIKI